MDSPCAVCAGQGVAPSGPCICKGVGTSEGEKYGLRDELIKSRGLIEDYELMLKALGVKPEEIKGLRGNRGLPSG